MRKIIISIIILLFVTLTIIFITGIADKLNKRKHLEENISKWPSFSFATLQDKPFNSFSITRGPVLIVLYHPDCEHCKFEISELLNSKIPESGVKILLVSNANRDTLIKFLDQFRLAERPEIIPLFDTAGIFSEIFGRAVVPSNYIYNNDLELIKILYGGTKTETIRKYLKKSE